MSDDEPCLIQQARQGDAAACAALYDRHYDAVYRYCYYHVGDVALAQDLASEVFVRMIENLATFDERGRPLLAWLYTIARNLIADGVLVLSSTGEAVPGAVILLPGGSTSMPASGNLPLVGFYDPTSDPK